MLPIEAIEIRSACAEDRPALQRMLELYQYELSDIWDQDIDAEGEYGYALERFWTGDDCRASLPWRLATMRASRSPTVR